MFYDRFAYLCKQKGVSDSRGAIEAGISKSLVTKWKKHSTEVPSAEVLSKLSKYFNVPISELLDDEPAIDPASDSGQAPARDILDEVDVAFYGEYQKLDEEQKETVRDMVRVMRERRAKRQEK